MDRMRGSVDSPRVFSLRVIYDARVSSSWHANYSQLEFCFGTPIEATIDRHIAVCLHALNEIGAVSSTYSSRIKLWPECSLRAISWCPEDMHGCMPK